MDATYINNFQSGSSYSGVAFGNGASYTYNGAIDNKIGVWSYSLTPNTTSSTISYNADGVPSFQGNFTRKANDTHSADVVVTPEPSSALLAFVALLALGMNRRR